VKTFPTILLLLLMTMLGACTASNSRQNIVQDPNDLLFDEFFWSGGDEPAALQTPDLFLLPEKYKQDLDKILASSETEYERYTKMRAWIYRRFRDFDFDVTETYTLSELSNNRKINCLSFSALFVAAARYVDVSADFQLVIAQPYWNKDGQSWINNQHINVIGNVQRPISASYLNRAIRQFASPTDFLVNRRGKLNSLLNDFLINQRYTIDVNPAVVSIRAKTRRIDEQQVLSLYYSNKSIEALLDDEIALAYSYTKQALHTDPDSVIAWNNLGVLYGRVNQPQLSIATYQRAIALDDEIFSAKSNLANSYRSIGKTSQARALEREVESFREQNPYYHSALADERISEGEYTRAIRHLRTALEQKHNEHYFYHQMAIANQHLGDMDAVEENLGRARRYARGSEKARFAGKLQALEAIAITSN
jgi:tetratricopeptide (TPR) repeat protein